MKSKISALAAGIILGLGLIFSEMVNPKRARGFLDVTGSWDPTLVFVMGGALLTTAVGYKLIFSRDTPLYKATFTVPTNQVIDSRLLIGAVLFGAGWGLSGLCPGATIVALSTFNLDIVTFMVAMIVGMKIFERVEKSKVFGP